MLWTSEYALKQLGQSVPSRVSCVRLTHAV